VRGRCSMLNCALLALPGTRTRLAARTARHGAADGSLAQRAAA
jgi:hypothetical protein